MLIALEISSEIITASRPLTGVRNSRIAHTTSHSRSRSTV